MNFYDYLKEYGNKTFEELPFNEVDNLIFSVLSYLDYTGIISPGKEYKKLRDIGIAYLYTHDRKKVYALGRAQKDAYILLDTAISTKRYKDIEVHHYIYISDINTQFSAMTFKIDKKTKYISYEGTDELISGWKEDFILSYKFPVEAHTLAIDYINEEISLFDKNIYVGGHSKGGNLALVASMFTYKWKRKKIVNIYSNDGPGLRKEEFESERYKAVRDRYIHIIPNYSVIGTLLHNDPYVVIESNKMDFYAHSAATWQVDGTHLKRSKQTDTSIEIEKALNEWVDGQTDKEKEEFCLEFFGKLEKVGFKDLTQIKDIKLLMNALKQMTTLDKKYIDILIHVGKLVVTSYVKTIDIHDFID